MIIRIRTTTGWQLCFFRSGIQAAKTSFQPEISAVTETEFLAIDFCATGCI